MNNYKVYNKTKTVKYIAGQLTENEQKVIQELVNYFDYKLIQVKGFEKSIFTKDNILEWISLPENKAVKEEFDEECNKPRCKDGKPMLNKKGEVIKQGFIGGASLIRMKAENGGKYRDAFVKYMENKEA